MYALERFDASKLEVVLFSSGIFVNAMNKARTRSLKCIKNRARFGLRLNIWYSACKENEKSYVQKYSVMDSQA